MTNQEFIRAIGPIIQKYAREYEYAYPSAIIAQACLESGYGRSSLAAKWYNYFGIKWYRGCGRSAVNLSTNEEYSPGILTGITAGFMVGSSMEDGVKMYFEFITKNSRYKNLKQAVSSRHYLELIKAGGYATSSTYVANVYNIVPAYNLLAYDSAPQPVAVSYAGIVTASALNVRMGAGTGHPILQVAGKDFLLPKGIVVAFDQEINGWAKLTGLDGWVSLQYVQRQSG